MMSSNHIIFSPISNQWFAGGLSWWFGCLGIPQPLIVRSTAWLFSSNLLQLRRKIQLTSHELVIAAHKVVPYLSQFASQEFTSERLDIIVIVCKPPDRTIMALWLHNSGYHFWFNVYEPYFGGTPVHTGTIRHPTSEVVDLPLPQLAPFDAARLLARRARRPFFATDFEGDDCAGTGLPGVPLSMGRELLLRLRESPVMKEVKGARIGDLGATGYG